MNALRYYQIVSKQTKVQWCAQVMSPYMWIKRFCKPHSLRICTSLHLTAYSLTHLEKRMT